MSTGQVAIVASECRLFRLRPWQETRAKMLVIFIFSDGSYQVGPGKCLKQKCLSDFYTPALLAEANLTLSKIGSSIVS